MTPTRDTPPTGPGLDEPKPQGQAVPGAVPSQEWTLDPYVSRPAASQTPVDPELDFGERFEVRGRLGQGGRGVVHRVYDRVLREEVALKTVLVRSPHMLAELRKEFRVVRAVHHPNLLAPWDLYERAGLSFFTMPLLDPCEPLHRAVLGHDDAPSARLDRLTALLPGLFGALLALHDRGIAHGDLKPANVLVHDGAVRVVDFGLARTLDDPNQRAAGTPPYMAPDVFEHGISIAGDVFSLGVVLFECLTGEQPFPTTPLAQHSAKARGEFRRLDEAFEAAPVWSDTVAAMLAPDPASRPSVRAAAEALGIAPFVAPLRRTPSFVGRREELARLEREHQAARMGSRCTVVRGASGAGKSALVRAFADTVDGPVLRGACDPRESVPYDGLAALIDAFAEHALLTPALHARLTDADIDAAADLFPALSQLDRTRAPQTEGGDPEVRRSRAILALRRLLGALAEGAAPLLVLEDFHWASADTRELVTALLGAGRAHWLLVVREAWEDSAEVGVPATAEIGVAPLGADDVRTLRTEVASRSSGPEERLPLALTLLDTPDQEELARALEPELDSLDAAQRRLLELAAVSRAPLPRAALLGAAGLRVAQRDLLTELEDDGWLVASDQTADFLAPFHARISAVVDARLDPEHRIEAHGALHDALASFGAEPGRLFAHALEAGRNGPAAHHARNAAERAMATFAFPEAAGWYARARALRAEDLDDLALAEAQARAAALAGRRRDAAEVLLAAVEHAGLDEHDDAGIRVRAEAATQLVRSGALDQGSDLFRRVFAALKRPFPKGQLGWMLSGVRDRLLTLLAWKPAAPIREEAADPRVARELSVLRRAGFAYGISEPAIGDALNLRQLRLARRHGVRGPLACAYAQEGSTLAAFGVPFLTRTAAAMLDTAAGLAEGDATLTGHVLGGRTSALWSAGRFVDSLDTAQRALVAFRSTHADVRFEMAVIETFRVSDLWMLGRYAELAAEAPEAVAEARLARDLLRERIWIHGEPAFLALVADDPEPAIRAALDDAELWEGGASTPRYRALQGLVNGLLYAGRTDEADATLVREWPALKAAMFLGLMMPGTILWWLRAKASLACARGATGPERGRQLAVVAEAVTTIRKRKENVARNAIADLLEASRLALVGQEAAAVDTLRRAASDLDELGMAGLAACARAADPDAAVAQGGREALASSGVVDPVRFAAVEVPGFLSR